MSRKLERLEYLDSIRGLAAVAVLLSHCVRLFEWPRFVEHLVKYPFLNIPFNGAAAVAMFFVLSGYLLSRPYLASREGDAVPKKINIAAFFAKRFTRIWMPWFCAFSLSALAQALVFRHWATQPPQTEWALSFWQTPLALENVVRQCLFISNDPNIDLVMQDWSLRLELQVSILLPFALLLYAVWPSIILPLLAIVGQLVDPSGCYFAFVVGLLLARYAHPIVKSLQPQPLATKMKWLMVGLIYYELPHLVTWLPNHFYLKWINPDVEIYSRAATSLGCAFILLASMSSRRIQATLHLPALNFLGKISYSVYLLQFIVLLCAVPPLIRLFNTWGIHQIVFLLPMAIAVSVGLTVALSALSYRWLEMPCIDLGRWLARKIEKPEARNSPAPKDFANQP